MEQDLKSRMLNSILSIEQLRKFQSRAARYDKSIDLFRDDFETLEAMGYLIQVVPEDLGGLGLSFNETCHQQRRLAHYSPVLAMAVKWHICWTGIATDLWLQGDSSLEWLAQCPRRCAKRPHLI